MPSYFSKVSDPKVMGNININKFIEIIKNPNESIVSAISDARKYHSKKNKKRYDEIKRNLPCVTLNFTFKHYKKDKNINKPTGFIYLDVDNLLKINLEHPLIFASWVSLSGKGRGILVKVDNLSLDNFKETYIGISEKLGINTDVNANKASQFTVLSYDKDIYINNDSTKWIASKIETSPTTIAIINKKRKDANVMGVNNKIRYDNLEDYDFKGKNYIIFNDDKMQFSKAYIPPTIKSGLRNTHLSCIAYQIRALNKNLESTEFKRFILNVNSSVCKPPLEEKEVISIVGRIEKNKDIKPILNFERRIIFNPKSGYNTKQKKSISNKLLGKLRSKKTLKELEFIVDKWDESSYGKLTQKRLQKISGKNIKTIEKYYRQLIN